MITKTLGRVIALLGIGYFAYYLITHLDQVLSYRLDVSDYGLLIAAALFWSLCTLLFAALPWAWLVRASGEPIPLLPLLHVYAVTQIAKYIPGNIAHQISRIEWASRLGLDRRHLAWTAVMETALTFVSALTQVVAAVLLGALILQTQSSSVTWLNLWIVFCIVLALPLAIWLVVNRWRPKALAPLLRGWQISLPTLPVLLRCYVATWLAALSMAMILNLLAHQILDSDPGIFWAMFSSWVLAWAAGYAMPGAPAGLGAREAVFLVGLANVMTTQQAILLTLMQRIVTVIADAVLLGVGLLLANIRSVKTGRVDV